MSFLDAKKEALRWVQFKVVTGRNRRYWNAEEKRLKAEIADMERQSNA